MLITHNKLFELDLRKFKQQCYFNIYDIALFKFQLETSCWLFESVDQDALTSCSSTSFSLHSWSWTWIDKYFPSNIVSNIHSLLYSKHRQVLCSHRHRQIHFCCWEGSSICNRSFQCFVWRFFRPFKSKPSCFSMLIFKIYLFIRVLYTLYIVITKFYFLNIAN